MKPSDEFVEQIQLHKGLINKVVFFYANHDQDRHDLYQEILYQSWKSYKHFKGDAKFSSWLYRISLNVAISFLRKKTKDIGSVEVNNTKTDTSAKELLEEILSVLNPVEKSIVLLLVEGYEQAEIAEILGMSKVNIRVKIHRLRKKLNDHGVEKFIG
ncbi:MAG: sigma-70 family RNA polymerase sigma factor [Bacteroidota bacterium]